jgi:hypothetical protein
MKHAIRHIHFVETNEAQRKTTLLRVVPTDSAKWVTQGLMP